MFLLLDFVRLRLYTIRGRLRKRPAIQSWIDDGIYQLQRRAFGLYVNIPWDRTDKEVPVTSGGQTLDSLSKCAAVASQVGPKLSAQSTAPTNGMVQPSSSSTSIQSIVTIASTQPGVVNSVVQPSVLHSSRATSVQSPVNPSTGPLNVIEDAPKTDSLVKRSSTQ